MSLSELRVTSRQRRRASAGGGVRGVLALVALAVGCGGSAASSAGESTTADKVDRDSGGSGGAPAVKVVSKQAEADWKEALATFEAAERAGWNEEKCSAVSSAFASANRSQKGKFAEAIYMSGLALDRCGQAEDAQKLYNQALEVDPKQCGAHRPH